MKTYHWLIAAVICNTLFRFSPFSFEFGIPEENHTSSQVAQALSFIFLMGAIISKVQQPSNPKNYLTGAYRKIYMISFWIMVSNLMDELFFKPLELGLNEILFAIIITINYCFGEWIKKYILYPFRKLIDNIY